jgi:hypothetical protein
MESHTHFFETLKALVNLVHSKNLRSYPCFTKNTILSTHHRVKSPLITVADFFLRNWRNLKINITEEYEASWLYQHMLRKLHWCLAWIDIWDFVLSKEVLWKTFMLTNTWAIFITTKKNLYLACVFLLTVMN